MARTTNFKFNLVDFDKIPWSDDDHDNWRLADAILAKFISIANLQGVWKNATAVTVGQRYTDPDAGTIWTVAVAHTTPSTGTFLASRTASPTYWTSYSTEQHLKGAWTTETFYNINDFAVSGHIYAVCTTAHTSGATFAGDSAKWEYLINATATVTACTTAQTAAELAETNASTSATNAATSATTSENAARSVAFRWNFDSSTTMADPGTGDIRFNHATISSATAVAISDLVADTGNPDESAYVLSWDDSTNTALRGTLVIREVANPGQTAVFSITGASTDNAGWTQLVLTYVSPAVSPTFTNGNALTVQFTRTGNAGAGVGDLLAANNLSDVAAAATAFNNIKQAASETATGVVEIATQAEVNAGTDTTRSLTPATLLAATTILQTARDGTPNADLTASGPTTDTFVAGATVAAGELAYLSSASKWLLADADAVATSGGVKLAISLESKVLDQAMKVALPSSFFRNDAWNWTPGAVLYVGETAGTISASIPTGVDGVVRVVGFAVTADVIFFNPSDDYVTIDASGTIKNVNGIAPAAGGGGSLTFISTTSISGAPSTVDIESGIDSTYDCYAFRLDAVEQDTGGDGLYCRAKVSGSYQTTGYKARTHSANNTSIANTIDTAAIVITRNGNAAPTTTAGHGLSGWVFLFKPADTTVRKMILFDTIHYDGDNHISTQRGGGWYDATTAVTGIRFAPTSGAFRNGGRITLYGIKHS